MDTFTSFFFLLVATRFTVEGINTNVTTRFQTAVVGHNVLIACRLNETASNGIYWKKNDTATAFRQNGTLLTFVNIRRASTGLYICYSYNKTSSSGPPPGATIVDKVAIDVLYPATITNITISPTTVTENQTFTVTCSMTGNPPPSYMIPSHAYFWNQTWYNTTRTSVTITRTVRAQCRDIGTWGCYARNKLNIKPAESSGINVTVLCSPRPQTWFPDFYYHIECGVGQSETFEMYNLAYPPSNYSWSHNGTVLPATMHKDYMVGNSSLNGVSILNISDVSIQDFGNYTLTMMNSVGTYVAVYNLLPRGPPVSPTNLTFTNVTREGATIRWVSGFDMWKHQQFVINRYIHGGSAFVSIDFVNATSKNHGVNASYNYVVRGLKPGTNYTLIVASQSGRYVSYTNDISFKTKGSSPAPPINGGSTFAGLSLLELVLLLYSLSILRC